MKKTTTIARIDHETRYLMRIISGVTGKSMIELFREYAKGEAERLKNANPNIWNHQEKIMSDQPLPTPPNPVPLPVPDGPGSPVGG